MAFTLFKLFMGDPIDLIIHMITNISMLVQPKEKFKSMKNTFQMLSFYLLRENNYNLIFI